MVSAHMRNEADPVLTLRVGSGGGVADCKWQHCPADAGLKGRDTGSC